jgi:hypothetical protein
MSATANTPKDVKMLKYAPSKRLPSGGGKRAAKVWPDPGVSFAQDLDDRANAPFHFRPVRNHRHFGINE